MNSTLCQMLWGRSTSYTSFTSPENCLVKFRRDIKGDTLKQKKNIKLCIPKRHHRTVKLLWTSHKVIIYD